MILILGYVVAGFIVATIATMTADARGLQVPNKSGFIFMMGIWPLAIPVWIGKLLDLYIKRIS